MQINENNRYICTPKYIVKQMLIWIGCIFGVDLEHEIPGAEKSAQLIAQCTRPVEHTLSKGNSRVFSSPLLFSFVRICLDLMSCKTLNLHIQKNNNTFDL